MKALKLLSILFGITAFSVAATAADAPKVGDQAPDFSLQGSDGKTYKLSDYRGKQAVVIAWYPRANTPGCTAECKSISQNSAALRKLDAAYFTASVDEPEMNKKFAETVGADYPILSDPTKDTAKAYGVLSERGFANRWTFYIDKEGKITHIDKEVKAAQHGSDIVTKLKALGVGEKK
jgi:peroxiredoxin Q/BCP